jgi:hypothetical protein
MEPPTAWWQHAIADDVIVWVRDGASPWRTKQIRAAVEEFARVRPEKKAKGLDRHRALSEVRKHLDRRELGACALYGRKPHFPRAGEPRINRRRPPRSVGAAVEWHLVAVTRRRNPKRLALQRRADSRWN